MKFFRIPIFPSMIPIVVDLKNSVSNSLIFNPGGWGTPMWLEVPANKDDADTVKQLLEEASGKEINIVEGFN